MDIHEKLHRLLESKGITTYRLAINSGLSHATIANIFKRNTIPSISTLESICKGLGITLSQFFAENEMIELIPELKEIFDLWLTLSPNQKTAVLGILKALNENT